MYSNETKVYIAIIAGVLLLTLILVVYIISMVKHQKEIASSYQNKIDIEVNILERERRRISSDLHDDLGPFLSSMKLQINLLNTKDPDDLLIINELTNHLNEIVRRIRETSNDLMPSILINKGLVKAIENVSRQINSLGNLHVETYFIPDDLKLPAEIEIHLFRIFQETLNNTLKHSGAKSFAMKLHLHVNKLYLIIEDDGNGFDYPAHTKKGQGMGLKNISLRVDLLKGTLYRHAKPGSGVKYKIEVPI